MASKGKELIDVSRERCVRIFRVGGPVAEREMREELEGLFEKSYRVAAIKRVREGVDVHLVKRQQCTVDEIVGEITDLLKAEAH
jgi:hypothetical protein